MSRIMLNMQVIQKSKIVSFGLRVELHTGKLKCKFIYPQGLHFVWNVFMLMSMYTVVIIQSKAIKATKVLM